MKQALQLHLGIIDRKLTDAEDEQRLSYCGQMLESSE